MPSFRNLNDPDSLRELSNNLEFAIYVMNTCGQILDANLILLQMFDVSSLDELNSKTSTELLGLDAFLRKPGLNDQARLIREFDVPSEGPDKPSRRMLDIAYPRLDPRTGEILYHGMLVDVSDLRQIEIPHLREERNCRDLLTGSFNRLYLLDFEREAGNGPWGCIYTYIDHFRQYTDRYGYEAGDMAVCKFSRFLMRHARAEDAVVRLSDEEFLVLLAATETTATQRVVKRIKVAALGQAPLSFSLGWAARQDNELLEKTIIRANQNLQPVRVLERIPKHRRT